MLFLDFFKSESVDSNISSIGLGYMQSEDLGIREEFAIFSLRRLCILIVLIYVLFKTKNMPLIYMGGAYLAINILTGIFPISCSKYMSVLFICVILYFFLRDYLTPYAGSSMRYIDQYYPYHSIFDPVVEYERQNYFQL